MFEDLIPELQDAARQLVQGAGEAGLPPRVTSTRRSPTKQARLYRRWLSGLSPLPAAPPGTSAHEFGYAFDMVVSPFEALADVGYTWQEWGGLWGSSRDPVHFEYPGFVRPLSPTAGVVQTAVQKVDDLPWYVQLFLPTWAGMHREADSSAVASAYAKACKAFAIC